MSDVSRIEYQNKPQAEFTVRDVSSTQVVWEVDFEQQERPRARDFDALGTAEVKLLTTANELPDELNAKAMDVFEHLSELQSMMAEARGLEEDSDEWSNLMLGNLDALPEVEKRVE